MKSISHAEMEQVNGGWLFLAGFLLSLSAKLLLDTDFTQGLADGIVG